MIQNHDDPFTANLGVLNLVDVPFPVKRIYWITNFRQNISRGNHAHKRLTQSMLILSGKMELVLFDGELSRTIPMTEGDQPVLIRPGQWRIMRNASPNAVVLVLASHEYDEEDYIRDWDEYVKWHGTAI